MGDGRYDQIYVSMEALEDAQNRLRKLCSYLSGQRNSISSIANGLTRSAGGNLNISLAIQSSGGRKSSVGDIKSVLRDLSAMLDACSYESNRIQSAVKNAADLFAENEKHLTTCVGAEAAPMPMQETGTEHDALWEKYTGSVAVKNTRLETDWRGEQLFKQILTAFGPAGRMLYGLGMANTPKGLIQLIPGSIQFALDFKKTLSKVARLKNFSKAYGAKFGFRQMYGLRSVTQIFKFSPSVETKISDRFMSNLSRGGSKVFKSRILNPFEWITQGIDKGFENYAEYKSGYKSGGTAFAEWAAETALSVTAAAGATAVVAAAIPAAPIVVVSAVGGAIVWGVDTVWANTIGRGQDEDGGNEGLIEQVGEGAVAIGKAIGSKVTEGIGSVKGFLAKNANIKAIWSTSIWAT